MSVNEVGAVATEARVKSVLEREDDRVAVWKRVYKLMAGQRAWIDADVDGVGEIVAKRAGIRKTIDVNKLVCSPKNQLRCRYLSKFLVLT